MRYFCPLENVKTISGRSNNEVNGTSTNINDWEISSSGIWAGGKDSNTVGKGKKALGIFSQNWSIGSDGSIYGNIKFKDETTFENIINFNGEIHSKTNAIFYNNLYFNKIVASKTGANNIPTLIEENNIYTKELFLPDRLNNHYESKLSLTGPRDLSSGGHNFEAYSIRKDQNGNEIKENVVRFNTRNLIINNLGIRNDKYYYSLPQTDGEIVVLSSNGRLNYYYYDIKLLKDFVLKVEKITVNGKDRYKKIILNDNIIIKTNSFTLINSDDQESNIDYGNGNDYSYNIKIHNYVYTDSNGIELEKIESKAFFGSPTITTVKGTFTNFSMTMGSSTIPKSNIDFNTINDNKDHEGKILRPVDDNGYLEGVEIHRYSIIGKEDIFKYNINNKQWRDVT